MRERASLTVQDENKGHALTFAPPSRPQASAEVSHSSLTKVICTLGVKSRSVPELVKLLEAGMNVARFDFSWGSMAYHTQTLENLRAAMRETKMLCATMLDTRGPEIGCMLAPEDVSSFDERAPKNPIVMTQGARVTLTTDASVPASDAFLPVNNPDLVHFVAAGDDVFVGQYLFTGSENSSVYLTVDEVDVQRGLVRCTVQNDAKLKGVLLTVQVSNKGDSLPTLSEYDRRVIAEWAVPNEIDFISLSFTNSAEDIRACRACLAEAGSFGAGVNVIAKVERLNALLNIDSIVEASDGVILSRGNLGLDMPAEKVFLTQKMVLFKCNAAGKPAVVTRVVDTMTDTPRPTRAEATDVANAVLDGADAILLGAETLRGDFASDAVTVVRKICRQAEKVFDHEAHYQQQLPPAMVESGTLSQNEALASSAVRAASKVGASLIVVFTRTGRMARLVSKYRPNVPIVSLVIPRVRQNSIQWVLQGERAARQGLLSRGLVPLLANPTNSDMNALLQIVFDRAKKDGVIRENDQVIVIQKVGTTSVVKAVSAVF